MTLGLLIAGSLNLYATDYKPWTSERELELYPRFDYAFEHYSRINSADGSENDSGNDHFYTLGVSGSYTPYSVELEVQLANSNHRSFGFDHAQLTGRYHWLNDIVGDPVSLAFGASLSGVSSTAVREIGSFHHGEFEAEAFISFGKECTCLDTWTTRWWGVTGIGIANHGSPWVFSEFVWEKKLCDYNLELFAELLVGLGDRALNIHHFHGYGSVEHRSLDLGTRLHYHTHCYGIWIAELAQRVWGYNFPQNATIIQLSVVYPFGL